MKKNKKLIQKWERKINIIQTYLSETEEDS